jgi:hypothetical protein
MVRHDMVVVVAGACAAGLFAPSSGHPGRGLSFAGSPGALPLGATCPYSGEDRSWVSERLPGAFRARSAAPDASAFASSASLAAQLQTSVLVSDVKDESLAGSSLTAFKTKTESMTDMFMARQMSTKHAEKHACLHRQVHAQTLFGGEAELHLSRAFNEQFQAWGVGALGGLLRISGSKPAYGQSGADLFGMALELVGRGGRSTDLLFLSGAAAVEASHPDNANEQLWLFNLLDAPSTVGAISDLYANLGFVDGSRILYLAATLTVDPKSLLELTFFSRTPYRLPDAQGRARMVKMRMIPALAAGASSAPLVAPVAGEGSNERVMREMAARVRAGDVVWNFDLQFMQPGDSPEVTSSKWSGPWLTVGQLKAPRVQDEARATSLGLAAERNKFTIWKDKQGDAAASNPDLAIFYPHGAANQARQWAYNRAHANRGLIKLTTASDESAQAIDVPEDATVDDPAQTKLTYGLLGAGATLAAGTVLALALLAHKRRSARASIEQQHHKSELAIPDI